MSQQHWKTVLATALCAAACSQLSLAQVPPPTILVVDVENVVGYGEDTSDFPKFATDPNVTVLVPVRNLNAGLVIGDIVAVNGEPAKGTITRNARTAFLTTSPTPGQAIADTVRNAVTLFTFEILKSDLTPIGTIVGYGFSGGPPSPGVPLSITTSSFAITGGMGAFLGVRGQFGKSALPTNERMASMTEDPANRRRNLGGPNRWVLQVIPMSRPEIVITSAGPAIFHADFSPVTAAKPAKAGEVLIVKATSLGPTLPGIDPGQQFPTDALQPINSPVAVTVNGQVAEVVNGIGWPGLVDTYRVDFRVPTGVTGGTAAIQLSAAWIGGPSVNIPVQ
jgi:hypothetical protein